MRLTISVTPPASVAVFSASARWYSRVTTPLDFRDRLLSPHGAGFSLQPLLRQSAWFRPHNRSEDIKNLYLVGAGTHPGAGMPAVLASAAILDKVAPDASVFA